LGKAGRAIDKHLQRPPIPIHYILWLGESTG
jgi:hypothetical protein